MCGIWLGARTGYALTTVLSHAMCEHAFSSAVYHHICSQLYAAGLNCHSTSGNYTLQALPDLDEEYTNKAAGITGAFRGDPTWLYGEGMCWGVCMAMRGRTC